jgi:hypothetical protein
VQRLIFVQAIAEDNSIALQFRLADKLPLQPNKERPRIDYVILLVNLTSRDSWGTLQTSAAALDPLYLHGRCTVVATRGSHPHASVTAAELDGRS